MTSLTLHVRELKSGRSTYTRLRFSYIHLRVLAVALAALLTASNAVAGSISDVAVNVGNNTIAKLNAADGTVLWSVAVNNDGALAVDPLDFGVYTGNGSHSFGGPGTVVKFDANGFV